MEKRTKCLFLILPPLPIKQVIWLLESLEQLKFQHKGGDNGLVNTSRN